MPADVYFLAVGHGDCTVIRDHDSGRAVIVDCPIGGVDVALGAMPEGLPPAGFDAAIITHSHADHLQGMFSVLSEVGSAALYLNPDRPLSGDANADKKMQAAYRAIGGLADHGTVISPLDDTQSGAVGSVHWQVLAPAWSRVLKAYADARPNSASGVVRFDIDACSVLVTGDADDACLWAQLLEGGRVSNVDVLRLPHHGAPLRVTDRKLPSVDLAAVIAAANSAAYIVSCGANDRHHPARATVLLLDSTPDAARLFYTGFNAALRPAGLRKAHEVGSVACTISGDALELRLL